MFCLQSLNSDTAADIASQLLHWPDIHTVKVQWASARRKSSLVVFLRIDVLVAGQAQKVSFLSTGLKEFHAAKAPGSRRAVS
jgi:hypothetical protein